LRLLSTAALPAEINNPVGTRINPESAAYRHFEERMVVNPTG
jgi:hypothetical protein